MRTIKIAHCADVHLGFSFKSMGVRANLRKSELKNTFFNILRFCTSENVDILLIAGDLFEDTNVDNELVEEVKNEMEKLNFKIAISPGNHDPFTPGSPYDSEWPENVIIFKGTLDFIEISDLQTRIYGMGFQHIYEEHTLVLKNLVIDKKFINLGLIHGEIAEKSYYNPINSYFFENSGLDYIALGHIHKKSNLMRFGSTFCAYSGSPESMEFETNASKGLYFGEISKNNIDLKFHEIGQRSHILFKIDVSDCNNNDEVFNKILTYIKNNFNINYQKNLYRIILNGEISENFIIDSEEIKIKLENELYFNEIINKTEFKFDIEKLISQKDLKGFFIQNLLKSKETKLYNEDIIKLALQLGLKAFSKDVKYNDN